MSDEDKNKNNEQSTTDKDGIVFPSLIETATNLLKCKIGLHDFEKRTTEAEMFGNKIKTEYMVCKRCGETNLW